MNQSALATTYVLQLKRAYRVCRAWHRDLLSKGGVAGLLVLFVLVLGEPFACIIHCQFIMPASMHASHVIYHHHAEMQDQAAMTMQSTPVVPSFVCMISSMPRTPGGTSSTMPPSPVHEMLAMMVAIAGFLLFLLVRLYEQERFIPRVALSPPLRPPISFAA